MKAPMRGREGVGVYLPQYKEWLMWIRIMNYLFGFEYVLLRTMFGMIESRLWTYGKKRFGNPYLKETMKELLPGGKVANGSYVVEWYPITKGSFEYYNSKGEGESHGKD